MTHVTCLAAMVLTLVALGTAWTDLPGEPVHR